MFLPFGNSFGFGVRIRLCGLPFGIISAFRPFKGSFTKDFTDEEQKALIKVAKSDSLTKDFLKENDGIYRKLCNCKTFNKTFVDKFTTDKSKVTMKDFMSTQGFITKYKYSYSDYIKETQHLKSFLDGKRDFLGYIQAIGYWKEKVENDLLPNKEIAKQDIQFKKLFVVIGKIV
ncbi:hypothetical protein KVL93_03270 [Helicobacter pylori]|nr:hypothetical protein KVL93_03270 [Helicobacter pylori]